MGHAEVMAIHDVIARYWWHRGYDVLNPIGWDSFGLPAENAAIKRDEHPATYTYANIEKQAESFRRYAVAFDWSRRLHTSDPEYYRWTQWLFLRFRERGLAYRKFSPVNWCPNDQTVLANEQVIAGMCERCGAEVTKRELSQWYFKVTDYAQRLLDDMEPLEKTWPERVLAMQRNWIGRSEGAHVDFAIEGRRRAGGSLHDPPRHPVRRDVLRGGGRREAGGRAVRARAARGLRRLPGGGPPGHRHRPAVDGAAEDRCVLGAVRDQPGERRADPRMGRRLRAGRLRHRRDHGGTGSGPARLGLRRALRPADRADRAAPGGLGGQGVRRRRTGRQLRQRRGLVGRAGRRRCQAHDHRLPGGARDGHRSGELPAARLAVVTPAVLGVPDPDRALPVVRRGAGSRRPAARRAAGPARRRPEAQGHLSAGGGRGLGQRRVPELWRQGAARHRHDGHVRRLVVVLPALLLAPLRGRPLRRGGGASLDARRAVRRRSRARDLAPDVRAVLHQGAARHGDGRLRRAVHRPC